MRIPQMQQHIEVQKASSSSLQMHKTSFVLRNFCYHACMVGRLEMMIIGDPMNVGISGNDGLKGFPNTTTHIHKSLDVFEPFIFPQGNRLNINHCRHTIVETLGKFRIVVTILPKLLINPKECNQEHVTHYKSKQVTQLKPVLCRYPLWRVRIGSEQGRIFTWGIPQEILEERK